MVIEKQIPRELKSLWENLSSLQDSYFLFHLTQRSAFGCTLGYTESPLRGWFLSGSSNIAAQTQFSHRHLSPLGITRNMGLVRHA